MSALASFNYSNTSIVMFFLFPIVLPMPALMLWLEVKAFRRSEAQSIRAIVALLMMIGIACLYLYPFHFPRLSHPVGFFQVWYLLLWLAVAWLPSRWYGKLTSTEYLQNGWPNRRRPGRRNTNEFCSDIPLLHGTVRWHPLEEKP